MSTDELDAGRHEPSAQTLLLWMAVATLVVTLAVVVAIVAMGVTAGMFVAYGTLIVAAFAVFAYIMRFIGPEG
jgi:hypothetical protein